MEINVNEELLNSLQIEKSIVKYLKENEEYLSLTESHVYLRFPLFINELNENCYFPLLIISRSHGVVILLFEHILENHITSEIKEIIESYYLHLRNRLIKSPTLRKSLRELMTPMNVVCIGSKFNDLKNETTDEIHQYPNWHSIKDYLIETKLSATIDKNVFSETVSVIEGTKYIITTRKRTDNLKPRQKIIASLEQQIALFDNQQRKAAIHTLDKPQRIRGLAGSGKTVILAMKAALIHTQFPDAKILYTFYTKSLYDSVKKLITRLYRQSTERDPNWDNLHIMHAWGGKIQPGVYYNTCQREGITPKRLYENGIINKFESIIKDLDEEKLMPYYDYSLLDEAQDFPNAFLSVCRKITKEDRIIWAYDEAQNILEIDIQDTVSTFGKNDENVPYIDFKSLPASSMQDVVLKVCYRNPRRILCVAFALGFGLYGVRIVQMLENNEHWADFGFEVLEGNSVYGENMKIIRPEENSPLKDKLLEDTEIIKVKIFENFIDECNHVVEQVENEIDQGLTPEDILIICLDNANIKSYFDVLSSLFIEKHIKVFNILKTSFYDNNFSIENAITLSSIMRAKGNEALHVFIIGVDYVYNNSDSISERNKLFTALTRSKAWVTITGMEPGGSHFLSEYNLICQDYPYFKFVMPDLTELKIFQRDLAESQAKLIKILELIDSMPSELIPEDLKQYLTKNKIMIKK